MSSLTPRSESEEQSSSKRNSSKVTKLCEMDTCSSVDKDESTGTDQQSPDSILDSSDQAKLSSKHNSTTSRTISSMETSNIPRIISKPRWTSKSQIPLTEKITESKPPQNRNPYTASATRKIIPTTNAPFISKPRDCKKPEIGNMPTKLQRPVKNSARMLPSTKSFIGTGAKKNDESTTTSQLSSSVLNSVKTPSITVGDSEIVGQTARDRVLEKNKLTVFEVLQKKLEAFQSEFMQKFQTLKKVSPDKLKEDYKFITMIKNDECKLIVQRSDLINMPKLPVESINDIKQKMKETSNICLMYLIETLKNIRNKTGAERDIILEDAYNSLENKQEERIEKLFEHFQKYIDKKGIDYVSVNEKLQKEIKDTKKNLEATENELKKVKTSQEATVTEMEVIINKQKDIVRNLEDELDQKSIKIFEINSYIEKLESENEELQLKIKDSSEDSDPIKSNYVSEIQTYKEKIEALNQKLKQDEEMYKQLKCERDEIAEKFRKVTDDVHTAKIRMEEFKKKAASDLEYNKNKYKESQAKVQMELESTKKEMEKCQRKSLSDLHTSKEKLEAALIKTQTQLECAQEMLEETRINAEQELTQMRNKYETNQIKLQTELSEYKKKIKATEKKSKSDLTALQDQLKYQQTNDSDPNEEHLKHYILELEAHKAKIETIKQEKKAVVVELNLMEDEYKETRNLLQNAESRIRELTNALEYQKEIAEHALPMRSDDYDELMRLREAEKKKKHEIDYLRAQISAVYNGEPMENSQGEYTSQNSGSGDNFKLLSSLNASSADNIKLVASLGEQNTKICKLNQKLVERDEDYRSLFKTLNHKQVDVVRYEHMIRLLVNSNERSQMLRVRMEDKLSTMEDEIRHLKQTIRIYQQHIVKMI